MCRHSFSNTAIYSQYLQAFFFELCNRNIRSPIPRYRPQFIQTSNWLVIPLSTTRNQLLSANFEMRPSNKKISDHCLSRVLIEPQRRLNPLCHQTWLTPALSLEYTESQHRLFQTGNDFMLEGAFFNCSSPFSVPKWKTSRSQPGQPFQENSNVKKLLVGWASFFILVLKMGRAS